MTDGYCPCDSDQYVTGDCPEHDTPDATYDDGYTPREGTGTVLHHTDATYDDGYSPRMIRARQGWGHGPVMTTRRFPEPLARAWCIECMRWVGPDRTGDPNSLRLVEDDAITHLHSKNADCGTCESCRSDGALFVHPTPKGL